VGELKVLQGGKEQRADSCAACLYSRLTTATTMRCDAFAGMYAEHVRATHPLRCPGYVQRARSPVVRETHPAGWLKRALLRFLRWVW
jgi:hypothetical protein